MVHCLDVLKLFNICFMIRIIHFKTLNYKSTLVWRLNFAIHIYSRHIYIYIYVHIVYIYIRTVPIYQIVQQTLCIYAV